MTDDTTQQAERHTLSFKDDKGASRSTWIAGAILIGIVGWMGSGFIFPSSDASEPRSAQTEPAPVAVAVQPSRAEEVTLFFQAEGQAMPDRDTAIRAEASGDVAELLASKGDEVAKGEVLARLTTDQAEADLRRARQEQERAQREFDNATALRDRGVATQDRVSQATATLASAEAAVTAAEEALERTSIVAPFDGRIETLTLDEGEYIAAGTEIGRIVDNRPLTVSLQVPQQALNRISDGQPAEVTFITGEKREGEVSFVGTSAASETRTFLTEITVPNEDGAIPAGISAEIVMPTGTERAHFVSPSVISLSAEGATGIKTVEDGKVAFYEVELVRAEVDGLWVAGLPDEAVIITIGQGFVRDGEPVTTSEAETEPDAARELAQEATE
ncbi:efflux RND transporter periplasmic adaptor subunit [Paracoccus sediminicola]|uniref:efflux RND transporter periplasmic adaptor subunit n=1 Tax=Paracoccus sediminicola TaxID=3017783 RepID=UPI0022F02456|nr:efflux RND transporter periplasmic adaptor subunit [Paracoccus sediminicola]WBU56697.1 efflux RND transporter periplasmic adaptor subunit [Paracoccus sediminicola]